MSSHGLALPWQTPAPQAPPERLFYQIFPVRAFQPEDEPLTWFEVALHAEADPETPPGSEDDNESISTLKSLAEFLATTRPADVHCDLNVTPWYYTAQPPKGGDLHSTRLFRSLSVAFLNMAPYRKPDDSPLLAAVLCQLRKLGIPQLDTVENTE